MELLPEPGELLRELREEQVKLRGLQASLAFLPRYGLKYTVVYLTMSTQAISKDFTAFMQESV